VMGGTLSEIWSDMWNRTHQWVCHKIETEIFDVADDKISVVLDIAVARHIRKHTMSEVINATDELSYNTEITMDMFGEKM